MPTFSAEYLKKVTHQVLRAAGVNDEEANTVTDLVIGANLAGHDSHGIIQIPTYIDRIKREHIVPGAPIEILDETPTTFRVDGNWGFGYVVSTYAMERVIQKAKQNGIAAATIAHQGHVGRVASYPLMAVAQGLLGFMTADSGRAPKVVAPFGGSGRRLGTNPMCWAFPADTPSPVFVDMATSSVAMGKLQLYRNRGLQIPDSWIVDKNGDPATDPNAYFEGGAMQPLGGLGEGHKGYGLSVVVETLSGLFTGIGFGHDPGGPHNDGCFLMAVNIDAFRPLAEFKSEMKAFMDYLKDTPPAKGFDRVLYPGEIEYLTEQKRLKEGIAIEEPTWEQVWGVVREFGLEEMLRA